MYSTFAIHLPSIGNNKCINLQRRHRDNVYQSVDTNYNQRVKEALQEQERASSTQVLLC
ncbi:hypothetical protein HanXRQr2_Chr13g0618681 [Helianthus annuus]|uniref:Uncharacterized protein n=1 Tax=Helianthus annuus TaxID=4232 RepID=A0A251SYG7_HELAN|nr:hypothetical protein HanXRQr2_Chr13g0618681 [Helianthus annuus]